MGFPGDGNSSGVGGSVRSKHRKKCIKLNFQRGGIAFVGGVWMFSGTIQYNFLAFHVIDWL